MATAMLLVVGAGMAEVNALDGKRQRQHAQQEACYQNLKSKEFFHVSTA